MINTKLYGIYKNNIYEIGSSFDDTNLIFIYTIDQSAIDDTFEKANSMGWYKKRIDKSEIEKEARFIENCRIIAAIILLLLIFGGIFIAIMKAPSTPKIVDCINDTQLQNEIKEESIEILKKRV